MLVTFLSGFPFVQSMTVSSKLELLSKCEGYTPGKLTCSTVSTMYTWTEEGLFSQLNYTVSHFRNKIMHINVLK